MLEARFASPNSAGVNSLANTNIANTVTNLFATVCSVVHADPDAAADAKPAFPGTGSPAGAVASGADKPRPHIHLKRTHRIASIDHQLRVLGKQRIVDD